VLCEIRSFICERNASTLKLASECPADFQLLLASRCAEMSAGLSGARWLLAFRTPRYSLYPIAKRTGRGFSHWATQVNALIDDIGSAAQVTLYRPAPSRGRPTIIFWESTK
jgi:hypothetical protein